jgi:DNA-binding NarL/FixJ family response regulator
MDAPTADRPIRVLVADDHEIVRAGIELLLEQVADIELVGAAAGGEQAVALARLQAPDVVLMDLVMPGLDGIEATRRITAEGRAGSVVALTSFADRERILAALDAGAVGYLLKDSEPDELIAGIRAAAGGQSPLAPRVAMTLVRERRSADAAQALTAREREILALVAVGVPTKQIAARLGISTKTVKSHLTSIFRHTGVSDRLQAALWAQRHGIVEHTTDSELRR